jgi:hypothetical protein
MFVTAQTEIFKLMELDSFPRFLKSDLASAYARLVLDASLEEGIPEEEQAAAADIDDEDAPRRSSFLTPGVPLHSGNWNKQTPSMEEDEDKNSKTHEEAKSADADVSRAFSPMPEGASYHSNNSVHEVQQRVGDEAAEEKPLSGTIT